MWCHIRDHNDGSRSSMKYTLRDYQEEGVAIAVKALRREKHPFVIQAATGAGKSLMIADICHKIDEPILILQPSKEILEQNYQKLLSYDPDIDVGIYSASKNRREIKKFTFAMIGSIYKRPKEFAHFKYVLIDEAHRVNPKNLSGMLTTFLKAIDCKHVCGLTATPYRIDTLWKRDRYGTLYANASLKMINRISRSPFFRKILFKIETADLIERGYLCPIEYYIEPSDWKELVVNSTGANFTDKSMKSYSEKPSRVKRITSAITYSHQNNERTLVFCGSIAQAMKVQLSAGDLGIKVDIVTGKTPLAERERIIENFKNGDTKHIVNMGVFTTGFDMPNLDCIVLARPTMSLALYYQMIGRGVRIDPERGNKVLQVYDLVGITERLGRVETIKVQKEAGGFRDEVWSEVGRMDNIELYSFKIKPKQKELK